MRIAPLSDVHGNLAGLRAVLARFDDLGELFDEILCSAELGCLKSDAGAYHADDMADRGETGIDSSTPTSIASQGSPASSRRAPKQRRDNRLPTILRAPQESRRWLASSHSAENGSPN